MESKPAAAGHKWSPGQLLQAEAATAYLISQLLFQAADTEQLGAHKETIQLQPNIKYQQISDVWINNQPVCDSLTSKLNASSLSLQLLSAVVLFLLNP